MRPRLRRPRGLTGAAVGGDRAVRQRGVSSQARMKARAWRAMRGSSRGLQAASARRPGWLVAGPGFRAERLGRARPPPLPGRPSGAPHWTGTSQCWFVKDCRLETGYSPKGQAALSLSGPGAPAAPVPVPWRVSKWCICTGDAPTGAGRTWT